MSAVTVITCTLNPRPKVFARVMAALEGQTLDKQEWDYLVVDNGSDVPVEKAFDLSWREGIQVVREPEKGLTRARLRGIAAATSPLILFVDDDVVLNPDYLERAKSYFDAYPFVGALGGWGEAEYEQAYPSWMKEFLGLLMDDSLAPVPKAPFQYAMTRQGGPWTPVGSGMAVLRSIAEAYVHSVKGDPFRLDLDRKAGGLSGSGDADLAYTAVDCGMATAVATDLKFKHIIPSHRVDPRYVERLLYATNYHAAQLVIHRGWRQRPVSPPTNVLRRIRHVLSALLPRSWPDRCWTAFAKGYNDGLTGAPYDKRYV